jgi:hypothetical protein
LCSKYASSGVEIVLNGEVVKPRFLLEGLVRLDDAVATLPGIIGKTDIEKNVAQEIIRERSAKSTVNLGKQTWETEGKSTTMEFSASSEIFGGSLYVFLNGQFQFDKMEYLPKINLICMVNTNARPGDEAYPVDPGRGNLRQPYDSYVKEVITFLKGTLEKVAEHNLFKQGLNVTMFNKDQEPLTTLQEPTVRDEDAKDLVRAISAVEGIFSSEKKEREESLKQLMEELSTRPQLNKQQFAIARAAIDAAAEKGSKINIREEAEKIVDGMNTPFAVMVQRDFVSLGVVENDPTLTANLMILWQSILKRVTKAADRIVPSYRKKDKKYVPGSIFSNEAIGLYLPPQVTDGYYTIGINPISTAALVEPKLFQEKIEGKEDIVPADPTGEAPLQTVDKLSSFLKHTAVHEITHLLFPDSWGQDEFHGMITKVENICHFIFPEIRKDVKAHLKGLRSDCQRLIRQVARDRAAREKATAWVNGQCKFAKS